MSVNISKRLEGYIKLILVFGYLWKGREGREHGVDVKGTFGNTYNILF